MQRSMAAISRGRPNALQIPSKIWKDREPSPERTMVWTERRIKPDRKVPVVYYLSRNCLLEQPHFMEVPLSSSEGLYLRDVLNRLDFLRGKGMASMYSWSSKRGYKNGFVWHDLSENDFIYPAHGKEYVLKGSELLDPSPGSKLQATASSRSMRPPEMRKSGDESDFPSITHRRNQSWSSIDLHEYKVYKTESSSESTGKAAADAGTQTDEKRRRRRTVRVEKVEEGGEGQEEKIQNGISHSQSTELSREEISPPPSDSSPETLESLMKADKRLILSQNEVKEGSNNRTVENFPVGRMKASSVLMQLISCGSVSFKNCGPTTVRDQGIPLIGYGKSRLPRVAENQTVKETVKSMDISDFSGLRLEDKAYFSGSLVETKKKEIPSLKRSSSYNADRSSQLKLEEKQIEGVRAKCIPRKHKSQQSKNEDAIDNTHGQLVSRKQG